MATSAEGNRDVQKVFAFNNIAVLHAESSLVVLITSAELDSTSATQSTQSVATAGGPQATTLAL